MTRRQGSKTADAVAAIRAHHLAFDSPVVFSDPWAIHLTSAPWRMICRTRPLAWLVFRKIFGNLRPVQANVLCRARYIEDQLDRACARGVTDYVILGAGHDSFALRHAELAQIRVWEVDRHVMQEQKQRRLKHLGVRLGGQVHYVSMDFEHDSLADTLRQAGLSGEQPLFFSLLGVSYYLKEHALIEVMRSIRDYSSAGVDLVIDIRVPRECVETGYLPVFERTQRYTSRRGEAMVTSFIPHDFEAKVRDLGFDIYDVLSPKEQRARYFSNTTGDLVPSPEVYLYHLRSHAVTPCRAS